jgi:hypothetical protein
MNPRLATLPLDPKRRVPVPFAQVIREDGTANFTAIDSGKVLRCAQENLCGLCGQPLTYWMAFIGGERSAASRGYSDPPMHVECAEDAFTLCPHLARPLVARRPDDEGGVPVGFVTAKPTRWAMGITRGFRWRFVPLSGGGVGPSFTANPFKTIRWWEYADGRAVEVTT